MADETKVIVEDGAATAAAAAGAQVAAVAADSAVQTATELAADQARVLSEETRLYREGIDKRLGDFQGGIDRWQTDSAQAMTTFQSSLADQLTALETRQAEQIAATGAALENLKTLLTPLRQETPVATPNIPVEPTRTEPPQKSAAQSPEKGKRKIRRI